MDMPSGGARLYSGVAVNLARCLALVLLAGAALLAPPLARAQDPNAPTLTVNQVDATAYPGVRAVVTVLDGRGVPVAGLVPAQFQAFEGTTQLSVTGVQAAQDQQQPLSVIVVIDVSGSMAGARMEQAKQAATGFVQSLGPNDQAAVFSFSDSVSTVVPLTNDRLRLTNGIAGLQPSGATALYEAVQTTSFAAASAGSPRSAVVLLTDGENEAPASTTTRDGSLAVARGAGVPVFTIGVGATTDEAYLRELASSTTGRYLPATPDTIAGVYDAIATLLRNQYVVTIRDGKPADGSDAGIQLVALVGNGTAGGIVSYKRGASLAPPAQRVTPAATQTSAGDSSSSNTLAYGFGAAVALAVLAIGAMAVVRWQRHQRLMRAQLKIIEPNVRRAAAHPLPSRHGPTMAAPSANGVAVAPEIGTGRLTEKGGEGRVYPLGAGPIIIGSSPRLATIVLNGSDVAPEHTRIWLRDGRYLLHHVGGMSRKTLIGGHPADWVVLEPGDELQIGGWRLTFDADAPEDNDERRLIRYARERDGR